MVASVTQGGEDEGPMLLDASGQVATADVQQTAAAPDEPLRELPPTGAIKFKPTSTCLSAWLIVHCKCVKVCVWQLQVLTAGIAA